MYDALRYTERPRDGDWSILHQAKNAKVYDMVEFFANLGALCVFAVSDFFSSLLADEQALQMPGIRQAWCLFGRWLPHITDLGCDPGALLASAKQITGYVGRALCGKRDIFCRHLAGLSWLPC